MKIVLNVLFVVFIALSLFLFHAGERIDAIYTLNYGILLFITRRWM